MLKRLFVVMLALCMTSAMTAQNRYSLRGQLTDGNGDPLPFSNAVILNTTDSAFVCGTTSDVEGVFAFDKVAAGSYILRVSSIGYESLWLPFAIVGDTNLGQVVLMTAATMLSEVKVTARRPLYSADGEKVFYNVGVARNGGITLNTTLRPVDFMNIRFYASLFDDYYRVQYRPGQWQESEMLCYSLRLNFWTKLWDKLQLFANAVYRSRTQTLLAEVDPYFTLDCGVSTDLFDKRLSLFLNVNDLFNTVRTGGESVNPYNPSTSESVHTSRYVSFGLTWRLGRTEMEGQQTHGKKSSRHKGR